MFEAHGVSFPYTEPLLFNYTKVNTVFHSIAPLNDYTAYLPANQNPVFRQTMEYIYFILADQFI